MAIVYALCCLLCGAVNDFLFKLISSGDKSSGKDKSCGAFVSIVGWVMVLAYSIFRRPHAGDLQMTLTWGCISGALSLISNVLVIEAMRYQAAGVCSTIFRLNMVLIVVGAHFFLGEPMTGTLICGIICAFCAILAFIPRGTSAGGNKAMLGFVLAIIACVLRAGMALSFKYGFSHGADENGVSMIIALFWAIGGILIMLAQERRLRAPTAGEWKISLTSGVFVTGIIIFMARMNMCGNASIVNPIAQMSFLGTFALSCIFLKEKVDLKKALALVMGCCAIVLLCLGA